MAEKDAETWTVYRQDDNGNRFVVHAGTGREEADRILAELQARGHKQLYWVEADTPAEGRPERMKADT